MRVNAKQQLASIRREALAVERQRAKAHLAALEERHEELRVSLRTHRRDVRRKRLEILRDTKAKLRAARTGSGGKLRKAVEALHRARVSYRDWLGKMHDKQRDLRAELELLRQEIKSEKLRLPVEREQLIKSIEELAAQQLSKLDAAAAITDEQIQAAVERARRDIHAERYDLRAWSGNRRRDRLRETAARRVSAADIDREVEANLSTAEELAYWHHERDGIKRDAKRLARTAPDEIAELVKERAEFDPERAIHFLERDAEAWLKAEIYRAENEEQEYPF
jgi:hypothetical protein